jgi:hypothetical protein
MAGFSKTELLPTMHISVQALSNVFGDRIISSSIGQHIHLILRFVIFLSEIV